MTMDVREEQENACDTMRHNSESDSIEIDQSLLQPKKQPEPRIPTPCQMTPDLREEYENARDRTARTKRSASMWTINRRRSRRTSDFDINLITIAAPSNSPNGIPA
jgi:hypothetical protein